MSNPLEVLCCYAHEDQEMMALLNKYLTPLQKVGQITIVKVYLSSLKAKYDTYCAGSPYATENSLGEVAIDSCLPALYTFLKDSRKETPREIWAAKHRSSDLVIQQATLFSPEGLAPLCGKCISGCLLTKNAF